MHMIIGRSVRTLSDVFALSSEKVIAHRRLTLCQSVVQIEMDGPRVDSP